MKIIDFSRISQRSDLEILSKSWKKLEKPCFSSTFQTVTATETFGFHFENHVLDHVSGKQN